MIKSNSKYSIAIYHEVLEKGRHYVEFEVTEGVLRPCHEWDAKDYTGTKDVPAH
jgi:hypothetical protein